MTNATGEAAHGSGMSLVRRYVHDAGGKIALASLPGFETRFKITLPPLASTGTPPEVAATPEKSRAPEAAPPEREAPLDPETALTDAKVA
jgi:hypothetical protein